MAQTHLHRNRALAGEPQREAGKACRARLKLAQSELPATGGQDGDHPGTEEAKAGKYGVNANSSPSLSQLV